MAYQSRGTIQCVLCGNRLSIGRKLCRPCYAIVKAAGKLSEYPVLGPNDVFESRIKKTSKCWLWQGQCNAYGYGIFLLPGEVRVRAHRYAYTFFTGKEIPDGKIIMHTCDNPPCVNPEHLRVGTKDENNKDTGNKHRHNYGLDHWNGRLSNSQVAAIRRSGKPSKELAKKYGVTYSHIYRIRTGESRK